MDRVHPLIRFGGPVLGFLILVYVINAGVDAFRADQKAARDAEREATLAAAEAGQDQEDAEADSATETSESAPSDAEGAPEEAVEPSVFFRQPTTNAIVPPTFTVQMGAEGLKVEPSGEI